MRSRHALSVGFAAVFGLGLLACKHDKPNFVYMPDMMESPAFKAQEEGAMRLPPEGTLARGVETFSEIEEIDQAARLSNPLPKTRETLLRGQKMYDTYCIVCHGKLGEGDGTIVPKFPRPPSLQSDKIRAYSDGKLFFVMTRGQNLMPSYAAQVSVEDRWAIAHYIRVLHRAKNPSSEDLRSYEEMLRRIRGGK